MEDKIIEALNTTHDTIAAIGLNLGVSPNTIREICNKRGIDNKERAARIKEERFMDGCKAIVGDGWMDLISDIKYTNKPLVALEEEYGLHRIKLRTLFKNYGVSTKGRMKGFSTNSPAVDVRPPAKIEKYETMSKDGSSLKWLSAAW